MRNLLIISLLLSVVIMAGCDSKKSGDTAGSKAPATTETKSQEEASLNKELATLEKEFNTQMANVKDAGKDVVAESKVELEKLSKQIDEVKAKLKALDSSSTD